MKELSKEQAAKLDELKGAVQGAYNDLTTALEELRTFRDEICGEIEDYVDGKSAKWKETDAGEKIVEWLQCWQDVDLDDPSEPDMDGLTEEA